MAIIPIPNQPVSFVPTMLDGCLCQDPEDVLLVEPNDTIQFQVIANPCTSEELFASPNFEDSDDWITGGFSIHLGAACPQVEDAVIQEDSFTPVIGTSYYLQLYFSPGLGQFTGTFGGTSLGTMQGGSGYLFIITATQALPLSITFESRIFDVASLACLIQAHCYTYTSNLLVELLDSAGQVVDDFDRDEHPERFTFDRDSITVTYPLSDVPYLTGCGYTIRVVDPCDETALDSQTINVIDGSCSLLFTACNTTDFGGFYLNGGNFAPQMRVLAKLTRPQYEYSEGIERLSNGRINRYWIDRRRKMELRIDRVGESAHRFLSTLPEWDHFYIGQAEYVMSAEEWIPGYEDIYEAYGGIIRLVEPREELMRKVRCIAENAGCTPPPNYHVQGTGPNTDYIVQEGTGDRFLIAEGNA